MSIKFDYVINDPADPVVIQTHIPEPPAHLHFNVSGLKSNKVIKNDVQNQAWNTYITIANAIRDNQKIISRSRPALTRWAVTNNLNVVPRAGKDLNAYYDRRSLKFFYYPIKGNIIYLVDSTDVIAHELGHAILDTMRPDFWSVQSAEIWAFHEAYADIVAILSIMSYSEVLQLALKETKENIRKSNIITRLAEQVGSVLYGKSHLYLRDAVNTFKYQDPSTLPKNAPKEKLASECHSFGRVFLGTWYEILCEIYEQEKKRVKSIEALIIAKNVTSDYLHRAIVRSPRTPKYHYAIVQGMLVADQNNESRYQDVMKKVFMKRNMMPTKLSALSNVTKKELLKNIKDDDEVITHNNETSLVIKKKKNIKLSNYLKTLRPLLYNKVDLYKVNLELALDDYYYFDKNDVLQQQVISDETEAIEDAARCLESISQNEEIGKSKMWKINRNKLVRSFVE